MADDKFEWSGDEMVLTQCAYCRHLAEDASVLQCAAFPSSIPADISANRHDHRKPWIDPETGEPGDRGMALKGSILFEPRPDVPEGVLDRLAKSFTS